MRYAIVENGKVTNIVVSNLRMKDNWFAVPTETPVNIGDTYSAGLFFSPDGVLRLAPEVAAMQELIAAIDAKSTAVSKKIDDYEAAYMEGVQDA